MQAVEPGSDVVALGCVACWLLCGESVLDGHDAMSQVLAHRDQQPGDLRACAPFGVPEGLARIGMRCLAKRPADRPTALALRGELRACGVLPWSVEAAQSWWREHADLIPDRGLTPPALCSQATAEFPLAADSGAGVQRHLGAHDGGHQRRNLP